MDKCYEECQKLHPTYEGFIVRGSDCYCESSTCKEQTAQHTGTGYQRYNVTGSTECHSCSTCVKGSYTTTFCSVTTDASCNI